jgi:hypothetical protein
MSKEYVKLPPAPSKAFRKLSVRVNTKSIGYRAWVAIWTNRNRGHVVIGAPTLNDLAERWGQITSSDFEPSYAQCVFICSHEVADATNLGGGPTTEETE